ncbi:MAG: hypothetical protein J6O17_02345 [Eubacterium sp.]|nr:hypothetical protein [Eubacterium sp.]
MMYVMTEMAYFHAKKTSKKLDYPEEIAKIQADINDIKVIISTIRDIQPSAPL